MQVFPLLVAFTSGFFNASLVQDTLSLKGVRQGVDPDGDLAYCAGEGLLNLTHRKQGALFFGNLNLHSPGLCLGLVDAGLFQRVIVGHASSASQVPEVLDSRLHVFFDVVHVAVLLDDSTGFVLINHHRGAV
jgi:hypothetical protein